MSSRLTPEQRAQIRILSDGDLYRDAITCARKHPGIENNQLMGLLEFSRSWTELERFVRHQKDERDWGEPGKSKKAHYQTFYDALAKQLEQLRKDVVDRYGLVPKGLGKNETAVQTDFFAGLLAREFIQHLTAEMMLREGKE